MFLCHDSGAARLGECCSWKREADQKYSDLMVGCCVTTCALQRKVAVQAPMVNKKVMNQFMGIQSNLYMMELFRSVLSLLLLQCDGAGDATQ